VRSALGISPSAWEEAQAALGEEEAAVMIAAILQRADAIKNPGGYLRSLTEKAKGGQFSLGPVLMALLRSRSRERERVA
jgi:replication initiation protein RepC